MTRPVRSFFNEHFRMVREEIVTTRHTLVGDVGSLAGLASELRTSSRTMHDAASFLALRLTRLEDAGHVAHAGLLDLTWTAFVARHLGPLAPGSPVHLSRTPLVPGLGQVLTTLGYDVVDDPSTSVAAIVTELIDAAPGELLLTAPKGTLVIMLQPAAALEQPDEGAFAIEQVVVAEGHRLVAARR